MKMATLPQAMKVMNLVKDFPAEQVQAVLASGLLWDVLNADISRINRDAVRVALGHPKLAPRYEITELGELVIPEKSTIEELISAGEYSTADSNISSKNFSITHRGSRKISLIHFKETMQSQDVERALGTIFDKKLALIEDLLAVGAHPRHRALQLMFPIRCLKSSTTVVDTHGFHSVPGLDSIGKNHRILDLCQNAVAYDCGGIWPKDTRFLLVEKQ